MIGNNSMFEPSLGSVALLLFLVCVGLIAAALFGRWCLLKLANLRWRWTRGPARRR